MAATLADIAEAVKAASLGTPLLTVVGEVVRLRENLSWFEALPLFGKRVLVTRTREQSSALSQLLRERGAEVIELPALELAALDPSGAEAAARAMGLGNYTWCLFTSANAVDFFWRSIVSVGWDARAFKCLIAAIGPATAQALKDHHLVPNLVARTSTSEGLLDALNEWAQRNRVPATEVLSGSTSFIRGRPAAVTCSPRDFETPV